MVILRQTCSTSGPLMRNIEIACRPDPVAGAKMVGILIRWDVAEVDAKEMVDLLLVAAAVVVVFIRRMSEKGVGLENMAGSVACGGENRSKD